MWVPVLGWVLWLLKPIAIDRRGGGVAVQQVLEQGRARLAEGLWVMIFPEGTRMPVGETRRYGMSGALLAAAEGLPIVPVAHNAGYFWPRRGWLKRAGNDSRRDRAADRDEGRRAARRQRARAALDRGHARAAAALGQQRGAPLDVEVRDGERVALDELAARLDLIAHQRREDLVGGDRVFDAHLHEPTRLGIHGRVPELLGVHLAEAFVALDRLPLLRLRHQPLDGFGERLHVAALFAALDVRAVAQDILQLGADRRRGAGTRASGRSPRAASSCSARRGARASR